MARITVEDCLDKVDNRFELVMVASKRARQIQIEGKDPMVSVDNDKPSVIALREIADGHVNADILIERPSIDIEDSFESVSIETTGVAEGEESSEAAAEASAGEETEADAETSKTGAESSTETDDSEE